MNLFKYLIIFIIFVSVTIFSTKGILLGNRNNSVSTRVLEQNYDSFVLSVNVKEKTIKRKKRTIIENNLVSNYETNLTNEQGSKSKEILIKEKIKNNLNTLFFNSNLLKNHPKTIDKFSNIFEKEMIDFALNTAQEIQTVENICENILKRHNFLLDELELQEKEFESLVRYLKNFQAEGELFRKENAQKIFLNNPDYDEKYVNQYLYLLRREIEYYESISNIIKPATNYLNKVYQNANKMFDTFFVNLKFDLTKLNKEKLKNLLKHFILKKYEYKFERIFFDDLLTKEDQEKEIRKIELIYSKKMISDEFYLNLKYYFVNGTSQINSFKREINLSSDKWSSIKSEFFRLIRNMKRILEKND
ncbi:hypothetical protein TUBRATIS_24980 [Tubulinosema ratisbonensis]|uniref:Uncharacterized protein n=1 Tax=Tubulinosema ratisbonensis TaxID=291195 RepID=A0A437AIQ6_9MICR|nr:hypothetical protein TUBRATIS_24980 [Tubulinosema ratisbonensis]